MIMIAANVCAHDVPPRWAFVCGLLRRYVRERDVPCCLFLWPFSLAFFYFLVKNGFYTEGVSLSFSATKISIFIPFLMFLLEFLLLEGECPNRF